MIIFAQNSYLALFSHLPGFYLKTGFLNTYPLSLVIDTFYEAFYVKYCSVLTQYYKIDLLIEITLNYIFRSFFMQFYASKNLG